LWLPLAAAWLDEMVLPRLGHKPTIPVDGVLMSRESMYYDTSKAMQQLGYDPKPIDGAIRAAVAWFADNGYLSKRRESTTRWQ
jgi:dihydroflavonol-4-reductase